MIQKKEKFEQEKKVISKTKDKSQFEKSKKISSEIQNLEILQLSLQKKIDEISNSIPNSELLISYLYEHKEIAEDKSFFVKILELGKIVKFFY